MSSGGGVGTEVAPQPDVLMPKKDAGTSKEAVGEETVTSKNPFWTALFDRDATADDELELKRGSVVEILSTDPAVSGDEHWWTGRILGESRIGVFPRNCIAVNGPPPQVHNYELTIQAKLDEGGFGKVYCGTWKDKEVAVKCVRYDPSTSFTKSLHTFFEEAKFLWRVANHRNIVCLLGVCMEPPECSLVMEFCQGGPIDRVVARCRLEPRVIINWASQVNCGMRYLHEKNLVHRDLKGSNILIKEEICLGDDLLLKTVKIGDLGLAKDLEDSYYQAKDWEGTPAYMAPENIKTSIYSKYSDTWSFGVVLWMMLTGEEPYHGVENAALVLNIGMRNMTLPTPDDIHPLIRELLNDCWQLEPEARPLSAAIDVRLEDIQCSDFTHTSNAAFHSLQENWKEQIYEVVEELKAKEEELEEKMQELNQSAAALERRCSEQSAREEVLKRQLDVLHQREAEVVEREEIMNERIAELSVLESEYLKQILEQHSIHTTPPHSRRGKSNFSKLKKLFRAGSRDILIGRPKDFQHKLSVQPISSPNSPSPSPRFRVTLHQSPARVPAGSSGRSLRPADDFSRSTPNLLHNITPHHFTQDCMIPEAEYEEEDCLTMVAPRRSSPPRTQDPVKQSIVNVASLLASIFTGFEPRRPPAPQSAATQRRAAFRLQGRLYSCDAAIDIDSSWPRVRHRVVPTSLDIPHNNNSLDSGVQGSLSSAVNTPDSVHVDPPALSRFPISKQVSIDSNFAPASETPRLLRSHSPSVASSNEEIARGGPRELPLKRPQHLEIRPRPRPSPKSRRAFSVDSNQPAVSLPCKSVTFRTPQTPSHLLDRTLGEEMDSTAPLVDIAGPSNETSDLERFLQNK